MTYLGLFPPFSLSGGRGGHLDTRITVCLTTRLGHLVLDLQLELKSWSDSVSIWDFLSVLPCIHTDYKCNIHFHELIPYVVWDLSSVLPCNHTDRTHIAHLHEQSLYVFWHLSSVLSYNHTNHKCNIHFHELSLYVVWEFFSILPCNHTNHNSTEHSRE